MSGLIIIGSLLLLLSGVSVLVTRSSRKSTERYWHRRENRPAPEGRSGWFGAAGGGIWGAGHVGGDGGHHGGSGGATPAVEAATAVAVAVVVVAGADDNRQARLSSTAFSNGSTEKMCRHRPETCSAA